MVSLSHLLLSVAVLGRTITATPIDPKTELAEPVNLEKRADFACGGVVAVQQCWPQPGGNGWCSTTYKPYILWNGQERYDDGTPSYGSPYPQANNPCWRYFWGTFFSCGKTLDQVADGELFGWYGSTPCYKKSYPSLCKNQVPGLGLSFTFAKWYECRS